MALLTSARASLLRFRRQAMSTCRDGAALDERERSRHRGQATFEANAADALQEWPDRLRELIQRRLRQGDREGLVLAREVLEMTARGDVLRRRAQREANVALAAAEERERAALAECRRLRALLVEHGWVSRRLACRLVRERR